MEQVAREYHYRVDGEGRIYHEGTEIVDPATLRFFLLALTRTPEGRWLAVCQGERNWFEPDARIVLRGTLLTPAARAPTVPTGATCRPGLHDLHLTTQRGMG